MGTATDFHRFVRVAHQRWVVWRALERGGLGALAACGFALPLIAVLWWRGEPALATVAFLVALGASIGLSLGLIKRPSLLDTAAEADRQFELHDLLVTALTLSRCTYADNDARAAVAAMAEARCAALSPAQMVLRRLGARAWGGIGLAAALVLTLSLMTVNPSVSTAQANADEPSEPAARTTAVDPENGVERHVQSSPRRRPGTRGDATQTDGRDADPVARDSSRQTTTNGDAAGGTSSRLDANATRAHLPDSSEAHDAEAAHAGELASGGGGAGSSATTDRANDPALPGGAASTHAPRTPPPWTSPRWNADRAGAVRAVERGTVPDGYRDLVREYFDRDAPPAR